MSSSKRRPTTSFSINDHHDLLVEILKRLDGCSLAVAACVCRHWSAVAGTDSIWEHICFRHVSPHRSSSAVVSALGGHRRLYVTCIRPVLGRLREPRRGSAVEMQLSLSLFCVDYYERLTGGDVAGSSSLMFLCKPLNV